MTERLTVVLAVVLVLAPLAAFAQQANRPAAIANATSAPVAAQAMGAKAANAAAPAAHSLAPPPAEEAVDIHAPFKQSFFFTSEDILKIEKALKNQAVVQSCPTCGGPGVAQTIPPVRRIALSGIIYKAADDWLIWINGQKVTPHVLLKEIVDIKVEREDVHLKWFDIGANKVLDITMRPNETYDIMTGVLIPGIMQ